VIELVWRYGLWIVLATVFLTMHWFGMSCCGGGRDRRTSHDSRLRSTKEPEKNAAHKQIKDPR
jgi:hypothetical protein